MEAFNFISFIGWRFTFRIITKKISGISNKMFTQTVRELEKDGLFPEKIFPVVPPKVEYKLSERKIARKYFTKFDQWALKITLINGLFALVLN
jgi:DNA-binding HxlR family transcriptional regulator